MAISPAVEEAIEREQMAALPAAPMRQLEAGEPVSNSPSLAATLSDLVRAKDMNRALKGIPAPKVREIPVVRITAANAITAEDCRRAVDELRTKRATEAIG